MSYIVTARKWRPQFFRDVISQHHVTETLKNAIKSGRVSHAYLFSGPRGVGKTTVARIFAKALNCLEGLAEEPCNVCKNCVSIQSGVSMDVQEIDGASHRGIDDAKDIISNIGYHAINCRYKMYIVDEVHMLTKEGFNALLKTLEEPPPNVVFVFATTEPHKIPVTILSRCQRFDFRRLSVHEIASKLKKVADTEAINIDEATIMLIARRATGAMRDAESIMDQIRSSRGNDITVADVNEILGIADREVYFGIIERCHEHDARGALEKFSLYYDEGGDIREFIEGLLGHLRDLLYERFEGGGDLIMVSDEMRAQIKEQSDWFQQGDIIRMIQMVTEVESSLVYAVMPLLRIEVALARMASMETTIQLKNLFDKLGGASISEQSPVISQKPSKNEAQLHTQDIPETKTETEIETEQSVSVGLNGMDVVKDDSETSDNEMECLTVTPTTDSIRASWEALTGRVGKVKPAIGPSLVFGVPESFENGRLTLSFDSEHVFHQKIVESNIHVIEEIIGAFLGIQTMIKCFVRHTGVEKKTSESEDIVNREPIIGEILDRFNGEIKGMWGEKNG